MLNQGFQSMKSRKTLFRLIAKALGEKASKCDKEADKVAIIRLLMFLSIFITNGFIVANALRHWNDKTTIQVVIDSSTLPEYQTPLSRKTNKSFEFE
jgi:hypothetical protein